MKVSSHAKSWFVGNLSSETPPMLGQEFSQKMNSHHQKKSAFTVHNWICLIKFKANCEPLVYGLKSKKKYEAHRNPNTNQKSRAIDTFTNFHLISGPVISSNSLITNWIWIPIFSLQCCRCQCITSVSRGKQSNAKCYYRTNVQYVANGA